MWQKGSPYWRMCKKMNNAMVAEIVNLLMQQLYLKWSSSGYNYIYREIIFEFYTSTGNIQIYSIRIDIFSVVWIDCNFAKLIYKTETFQRLTINNQQKITRKSRTISFSYKIIVLSKRVFACANNTCFHLNHQFVSW